MMKTKGRERRKLERSLAPPIRLAIIAVATATFPCTALGSSPILVSKGLRNLGNTCYLNAQLQSVFHIPRVRELISEPAISAEDILGGGAQASCKAESIGLQALREVFQDMEVAANTEFEGPTAPLRFCQALGIPVMEQQDAQEFWKLLLPVLELPALTDLYQGAYEDYITAVDGSGRERRREEPFLDLSLDVTRGSIIDSLKDMFETPELLSEKEGNGWRPEKGAEKVDALKGSLLRIQGLPSILQCHLKRFQYNWQTDGMSKVNDRFAFPEVLDLSDLLTDTKKGEDPMAIYDLQAVVVHVGEYGAGHYYAYVRPDVRRDEWYRYNDGDVGSVSFREVIEDSYGGRSATKDAKKSRNCRLLTRILGGFQGASYGWGGRASSAYMLQYVRRCEIASLYS